MKLDDIKAMDCDVITPAVAATVLDCDPQAIRITARECPERLQFPVVVLKSRVKIPRLAFIKFMEGSGNDNTSINDLEVRIQKLEQQESTQ